MDCVTTILLFVLSLENKNKGEIKEKGYFSLVHGWLEAGKLDGVLHARWVKQALSQRSANNLISRARIWLDWTEDGSKFFFASRC